MSGLKYLGDLGNPAVAFMLVLGVAIMPAAIAALAMLVQRRRPFGWTQWVCYLRDHSWKWQIGVVAIFVLGCVLPAALTIPGTFVGMIMRFVVLLCGELLQVPGGVVVALAAILGGAMIGCVLVIRPLRRWMLFGGSGTLVLAMAVALIGAHVGHVGNAPAAVNPTRTASASAAPSQRPVTSPPAAEATSSPLPEPVPLPAFDAYQMVLNGTRYALPNGPMCVRDGGTDAVMVSVSVAGLLLLRQDGRPATIEPDKVGTLVPCLFAQSGETTMWRHIAGRDFTLLGGGLYPDDKVVTVVLIAIVSGPTGELALVWRTKPDRSFYGLVDPKTLQP